MTALAIPATQELEAWGDRKLDNAIARGHSVAGAHMRNYEAAATITGVLLRERKRRLNHGEWLPWLEANFGGSQATAKRYIELAHEHVPVRSPVSDLATPTEPIAELPPGPDAWTTWAAPTEPEIVDAEVVIDPPMHYLPDVVAPDAEQNLRTQAVHWYEQGRRLERLLNDGQTLRARGSDDARSIKSDASRMAAIAARLKEATQNDQLPHLPRP